MYRQPKRVLAINVLSIVIGFSGFILGAAISGLGGSAPVIAVVINLIILVLLIFWFLVSLFLLIVRFRDKEDPKPYGLYILNVLISFGVMVFFTILYVVIGLAISTIVLPIV